MDLEVEERDEEDYESIVGSSSEPDWESSNWGRWPESGLQSTRSWTPSPKSFQGRSSASIISISPRGSLPARGSTSVRRTSASSNRMRLDEGRKYSNPFLLGFDLAQRRNSSLSQISPTRQSSVVSTGSVLDPVEDQRLKNFASMDLLRRRFSEAVEVTQSPEMNHTSMVRAALLQLQSPWSPDAYSDDDESEINTAPYVPTPDIPRHQPTLLSNYPLESAVRADVTELDILESSVQISPVIPSDFGLPAQRLFSTPPPPAQPIDILKAKNRYIPGFDRDYQFPPRSAGVPEGAGPPRPDLIRSKSTPFPLSAAETKPIPPKLKRSAGSFPIARSVPLGISPLRASTRRESVMSAEPMQRSGSNESGFSLGMRVDTHRRDSSRSAPHRQQSITTSSRASFDIRRASIESRRMSYDSPPSSVAERRMSIVMGTTASRRVSRDSRRTSSVVPGSEGSRYSKTSWSLHRGSTADLTRSMKDHRQSVSSTKSSFVSVSEYGYLGPQIVIDVVESPRIPATGAFSTTTPVNTPPRLRSNAPTSIPLPSPFFLPAGGAAPFSPTGSTRFNPMESFLGLAPHITPTPSTPDLFTPRTEVYSALEVTPRQGSVSIMDRPRPISPPEFRYPFPGIARLPASPQNFPSQNGSGSGSSDAHDTETPRVMSIMDSPGSRGRGKQAAHDSLAKPDGPRMSVVRKAVPQMHVEVAHRGHVSDQARSCITPEAKMNSTQSTSIRVRRFERRGAAEQFTSGDESLPIPQPHRSPRSTETRDLQAPRRLPEFSRQTTFDHAYTVGPMPSAQFAVPLHSPQAPIRPRLVKQPSVGFVEVARVSRPPMQRAVSTSSFRRFFPGSSKSSPKPARPSLAKPFKSSLKPSTAEDHPNPSIDLERTFCEAKDMLSRMADGPRSPKNRTTMLYEAR